MAWSGERGTAQYWGGPPDNAPFGAEFVSADGPPNVTKVIARYWLLKRAFLSPATFDIVRADGGWFFVRR